jgi:hypothetical protein
MTRRFLANTSHAAIGDNCDGPTLPDDVTGGTRTILGIDMLMNELSIGVLINEDLPIRAALVAGRNGVPF